MVIAQEDRQIGEPIESVESPASIAGRVSKRVASEMGKLKQELKSEMAGLETKLEAKLQEIIALISTSKQ
jgi:uncharacterized protein YqgV (UPF0045/DUF77 family)